MTAHRLWMMETPIGKVGINVGSRGVQTVLLHLDLPQTWVNPTVPSPLEQVILSGLSHYFQGDGSALEAIPVDFSVGTPFQQRVWHALRTIPAGETRTYGWLAQQVESPKAIRAVGQANRRNPIPIVVPCHRVIGADKKLCGYGGQKYGAQGLRMKETLLRLEEAMDFVSTGEKEPVAV